MHTLFCSMFGAFSVYGMFALETLVLRANNPCTASGVNCDTRTLLLVSTRVACVHLPDDCARKCE